MEDQNKVDPQYLGAVGVSIMRKCRLGLTGIAGLALACFLSGCQTWIGGTTLPSPRYLEHPPQYFPAEPDFPLQKELAYQEEVSGLLGNLDRDRGRNPAALPGVPAVGGAPR